ncbi:MAG: hypothetical protein OXH56_01935 [Gemmatimonadetes bacterium]|nr:hypothetical protein [Gemmatimonadota bacterium]
MMPREPKTNRANLPQIIMTASFTWGYFGILVGLMSGWLTIPRGHEETMVALLGGLTIALGQILSYWFGAGPKQ